MGYHPFCSPLGYCDLGSLVPPPAYDFLLGPLLPLLDLKPWCTWRANLSPLLFSLHCAHILRTFSLILTVYRRLPVLGLKSPLQATSTRTTPLCTPFALIHLVTCPVTSLVWFSTDFRALSKPLAWSRHLECVC